MSNTIKINSKTFRGYSTAKPKASRGFVTIKPTSTYSWSWTYPDPADLAVIVPEKTSEKSEKDGCTCKKCNEFYPYATANQEDNTLICWACRNGY